TIKNWHWRDHQYQKFYSPFLVGREWESRRLKDAGTLICGEHFLAYISAHDKTTMRATCCDPKPQKPRQ
ncbi:hypothetical protein, partial [Secundilactobacillus collinoides]|uniref:hypothetical protein n=1 Tax=Secundilactobacillus collinoides TaxID=33960 RepID=UPI001F383FDF